MIKVLFALSVAGFVFLVLFWVIRAKIVPQQEINERLKSIEEDVARASARRRTKKTEEGVAPFRERVIVPLENSIGRAITNMAPVEWSRKLEKKLASAGKAKVWSVQLYAIFWVVALLAGLFFSIRYVSNAQHLATELMPRGVRLRDFSDQVNPRAMTEQKGTDGFKQEVANHLFQWDNPAPVQDEEVKRLPKEFEGLPNGHMASHQLLIDDFCKAVHDRKLPKVHAWAAARYTIPGLIAHESALRGGETLDIPDYGDAPEDFFA